MQKFMDYTIKETDYHKRKMAFDVYIDKRAAFFIAMSDYVKKYNTVPEILTAIDLNERRDENGNLVTLDAGGNPCHLSYRHRTYMFLFRSEESPLFNDHFHIYIVNDMGNISLQITTSGKNM